MNPAIFRAQLIDNTGGIYNPGQQVDVYINSRWRPGQIQNLDSYTVRNSNNRSTTNKPPNQVFPEGGNGNANGENTNLIPGRQILFQGPDPGTMIPGTIVSKNYIVQIDGRTETVPHTRLRRSTAQPQPQLGQPQPGQPQPGQPPGGPPPNIIYHIGQQVEVNVNGEWRPGQIQGEGNYTVMVTATEQIRTIERRDVRPEGGYLGMVLNNRGFDGRPGSRIEFLGRERWLPGTIVSRNYIVQIDGRTETVPTTRLRPVQPQAAERLADEEFYRQIREMREQAANQNVPPRAAALPAGPAFEVHTAFNEFKANNWDKFMEIINRTTGTNTNFRNRNAPLQPLIDYVNTSESYNENKASLSPEDKAEMIRKKADIIQKINRIFTQIQGYSNYNGNIDNITNCIQYVLMQSPDFIDAYINTFVVDCFKAYITGSPESCVKGMYERVYLAFRDTASTLCLDQIQGVSAASSLCKPEYIEIYDCFYETLPQELLNDFSSEWYKERGGFDVLEKLTPEARIEDFVEFVRRRMNDAVRFYKAEASIRRYANKFINTAFGGRRSSRKLRKTNKKRSNSKNRKTNKRRNSKKMNKRRKTRRY
jgi:hypothetical protein